jgi:ribosome-associated protein
VRYYYGNDWENTLLDFIAGMAKMDNEETIKLDQFLKLMCVVQTGGEAKMLIQNGDVRVNGSVEVRRGRKLVMGDRITTMGENYVVEEAE